jgi:hypothetical protein
LEFEAVHTLLAVFRKIKHPAPHLYEIVHRHKNNFTSTKK